MPRHPRIEFPGALYHVFIRGNNRQAIFVDDEDRLAYLNGLQSAHERLGLTVYAFSLMGNHVHHLVEMGEVPLRRVMQSILTRYARKFNIRHGRIGHLFQGRYRAMLCERDSYLLELIRYIHLNPVRARLAKDPAEWPWSSHRAYLGREPIPWIATAAVLKMFGRETARARRLYEQFILDGIGREPDPAFEPSRDTAVVGPGEFQAQIRRTLARPHRRAGDLPKTKRRLEDILEDVARRHNTSLSVIRGAARGQSLVLARQEALVEAVKLGWRQVTIARALHRKEPWATYMLKRSQKRNGKNLHGQE